MTRPKGLASVYSQLSLFAFFKWLVGYNSQPHTVNVVPGPAFLKGVCTVRALHLAQSEATTLCPQQLVVRWSVGKINVDGPTISCLPRRPYHQLCTLAGLDYIAALTKTHTQTPSCSVVYHESLQWCQPSWQVWPGTSTIIHGNTIQLTTCCQHWPAHMWVLTTSEARQHQVQ